MEVWRGWGCSRGTPSFALPLAFLSERRLRLYGPVSFHTGLAREKGSETGIRWEEYSLRTI